MDDVVSVLARERVALEHLLFRLHHARGVLAADDERFLAIAAAELDAAAAVVRELEAARAAVVAAPRLARTASMAAAGGRHTLRDLADAAPEPYSALLQEHRAALGRLAGEVGALVESTRALANDRLAELLGGRHGRYRRVRRKQPPADGLSAAAAAAGYESLLAASSALRLPSLVQFLG